MSRENPTIEPIIKKQTEQQEEWSEQKIVDGINKLYDDVLANGQVIFGGCFTDKGRKKFAENGKELPFHYATMREGAGFDRSFSKRNNSGVNRLSISPRENIGALRYKIEPFVPLGETTSVKDIYLVDFAESSGSNDGREIDFCTSLIVPSSIAQKLAVIMEKGDCNIVALYFQILRRKGIRRGADVQTGAIKRCNGELNIKVSQQIRAEIESLAQASFRLLERQRVKK